MNNPSPPSPADRLTDLSLRLGEGADAWAADNEGRWLVAPLIAMIVAFIKEIAESLASLAALIRDGKLVPQPPSAPRQGSNRPADKPTIAANRSPARVPATAEQRQIPLPEPEMAPRPAASPGPTPVTPQNPSQNPPPAQPPFSGLAQAHWPPPCPPRKTAYPKPAPWHAHFIPITK